ncbi:hypothetical protein ACFPOD_04870 [Nitratireductor kimnyeongensis]|uniref:3-phosphoglycerate kinase n=1 Tax=Nitratireductor kimnyeongensis TaxID=430679 RepID=A0ABW0T522_9HYPH|nr:hypothetical protein [Nitratireductor kimnyeongensis]QZZ34583.1 hypothetical protein KW403_12325 [Nitratireductor kimnyeongensis]
MRALVLLVAVIASSAVSAGEIDIDIENFTAAGGVSELVFKVSNNTNDDLRSVFVNCAFMNKDMKAIDIGKVLISTIPANDFVYEKASIQRSDGVAHAQCRVKGIR